MAAGGWATNAELINDVSRLGWIGDEVLDLSYGLGKFWSDWQPTFLTRNDLDPDKGDFSHDARMIPPEWLARFDTTVWDPPYRMSGRPDNVMGNRYGIDVPRSAKEIIDLLVAGTRSAVVCTRGEGTVLVKCQNTINGGRYIDQERFVIAAATGTSDDVELIGRFLLVTNPQKQPEDREQKTPRNNVSALLAFRRSRDAEASLFDIDWSKT